MGLMIQAVSCAKISTTGSNFQRDTTVGAIYSFARLAGKDAAFTKHSAGSYGSPHVALAIEVSPLIYRAGTAEHPLARNSGTSSPSL